MHGSLLCLLAVFAAEGHDLIAEIKSAGYPIEDHTLNTEDGYILSMHRIPHKKLTRVTSEENVQPVILLLHGMMKTSASFVNQGVKSSLAYGLAEFGCDVWMGNTRGNPYSRDHQFLNPDDENDKFTFFNFSWEEIGIFDIPAMVDYIINKTGSYYINFIGDAEGGTSFLIMNSLKPEYNEKFRLAQLLNPVGYTANFPSEELRSVAAMVDSLYALGQASGIVEVSSKSQNKNFTDGNVSQLVVQSLVAYIASLGDFAPVGTSLKHLAHYAQNIRDKSFRRWDYGHNRNLKVYGTKFPPSYNLSRVTVTTIMYYRKGDHFLDERDVLAMIEAIPDGIPIRLNDTEHFDYKILADYHRRAER